ncbi:AAA family ATPase [Ideonella sp. A 288]|uniref:AAA family ATPase n=1 Tax=Ideonella sp. A 288 TaxID=1962181 RepID=UPI0011858FBA|nr:AAA family ATPase [Ideonella sp. A 288]
MDKRVILLLSGPIAVGKSTLGKLLVDGHDFRAIRSGRFLQELARSAGLEVCRTVLQQIGDDLDQRTDYSWLIDDVAIPQIKGFPEYNFWLLDSVRKQRQIEHFRSRFDNDVLHVHLTAPERVLRARYEARLAAGSEYEGGTPYDVAIAHPNEVASRALVAVADVVVETTNSTGLSEVLASIGKP